MLEKVPSAVGHALEGVRAGMDKLVWEGVPATSGLEVTSSAFSEGGAIPARFTADGEGVSPPIGWSGLPADTRAVILVVEDADSPTPEPFVHALACLAATHGEGEIPEGGLKAGAAGMILGHNTFHKAGWLPPDPPTGHGQHRYVFQVYALGRAPSLPETPEKHDIEHALEQGVLARGRLIGLYERPG